MDALVRIGSLGGSRTPVTADGITLSEIFEVLGRNSEDTVDNLYSNRNYALARTQSMNRSPKVEELTNEGSGRENFSTSSTGLSQPFLIMLSRRESTVFWIWGRIASICSRVKICSIMPLHVKGENRVRARASLM